MADNPFDLPEPGEPYRGIAAARAFVEIPNARRTQEAVANIRKTLAELPLPAKAMNAVSTVLTYTLIGISDAEISEATGLSLEQIERIKLGEAYTKLHADVVQSVLDEDSDDVKTLLAAHAKKAANRVVELATSAEEAIALSAAKDILDRAGHRPADKLVVTGLDELRIVHVVRDSAPPTIDITPEE